MTVTPSAAHSPSLWCRMGEMAMSALFLLWLAAVPHNQWLLFGPAWRVIELGPPWFSVQLALIALVCVNLAAMAVSLRHPDPSRLRAMTRIVANVGALAVLVYLLKSQEDLIVAAVETERTAVSLAGLLNRLARVGLAITVLVTVFEMGRDTFRLMDGRRLWEGFARE